MSDYTYNSSTAGSGHSNANIGADGTTTPNTQRLGQQSNHHQGAAPDTQTLENRDPNTQKLPPGVVQVPLHRVQVGAPGGDGAPHTNIVHGKIGPTQHHGHHEHHEHHGQSNQ